MSRTVRDLNLETRSARARLRISGKPYFRAIDPRLHLGYRKGKTGGKWVVRWYIGDQQYRLETIHGIADDHEDADGAAVLSYGQAQAKARELAKGKNGGLPSPLTVKAICEDYIEYLRAEKLTADDAEGRLRKHVYPVLGGTLASELTTEQIDKWKRGLISRDKDDPEIERKSKDSANRVLTMLKAALNRKWRKGEIHSDAAWRRVEPFKGVGRSRQVHLDLAQSRRLINAARGAFRNLVTAALLTGARAPHELVKPRVRHFRADLGTLTVWQTKHRIARERDIVLTAEAVRFFEDLVAGRAPDDLLLPKDDGTPWGKNHDRRPMREAVKRAKLPPEVTIYALRHTHISQSLLNGLNIKMIADNCGTSVAMIEKHYAKFMAAAQRRLIEELAFKLGLPRSNVATVGIAR